MRGLNAQRTRASGSHVGHERISTDFIIDNPHMSPRVCQKLITATMLLRAMPEPSKPEARNLRHEAHALIKKAVVQQAESSASCIRNQSNVRATATRRSRRRPSMNAVQWDSKQTKVECQSESASLTCAAKPTTTTLTIS
jgi:hypothetical protein